MKLRLGVACVAATSLLAACGGSDKDVEGTPGTGTGGTYSPGVGGTAPVFTGGVGAGPQAGGGPGNGGSFPTGGTPGGGAGGALPTGGTPGGGAGGALPTGGTPGSGGDMPGSGGVGTGGAGGGAGGGGGGGPIPHGACLDGITDFQKPGPFTYTAKADGVFKFTVPAVPAGCKVPIIHLANGTGATCGVYQDSLNRLASHGFLAVCYEDTNTGAGTQGIQAFDKAIASYPDLVDKKYGSTGHSQGGQAAFTVMALAEKKYGDSAIYAGLAMEPASGFGTQPVGATWQSLYGAIKGPMFMFSGLGTDGLVSQAWVQNAYDATAKTEEAYFWTANGATHIPVPNTQEIQISVAWFRWKLLGDPAACTAFKAIPKTITSWAEVASKNSKPCG